MAIKTKKDAYMVSDVNLELLQACIKSNQPALLVGETGTGKTTLIREIAREHKRELIRISVNGSMGVEEILGKWLIEKGTTKWQDGVLTDAIRNGHWVVMDEINAALPEILFTLHSLLDDDKKIILPEKDNEIVRPHNNFRFFATMNPPEEYAGTKDMNKALMSRFTAVLNVEVLTPSKEVKLLQEKGADDETAMKLVKVAGVLRKHKKSDDIYYFCSTRDLVQTVEMITTGVSIGTAFVGAVLNKMSPDEYKVVKANIKEILEVPAMPSEFKTLNELIKAATTVEEKLAQQRKELEEAHQKEMQELEQKLRESTANSVSTEFIEHLNKLAGK